MPKKKHITDGELNAPLHDALLHEILDQLGAPKEHNGGVLSAYGRLRRIAPVLIEDKARLDWLFNVNTPALIEVPEKQDCITDRAGLDHYRKLHPSGLAPAVKQANPARDNKPEPQPGRTFA